MVAKSDAVSWRAYTVGEIDRMRAVLVEIDGHNVTPAWLEDTLRTYMIGGVGPDELEKKLEELNINRSAQYEAQRALGRAMVERNELRAVFLGEKRMRAEDRSDLLEFGRVLGRFDYNPMSYRIVAAGR